MTFDFTLTGRTALLMHADNVDAADELDVWRKHPDNKGIRKAGDDRSPAWTWMTYLHHHDGRIAMPTDAIMAAIRGAGANISMGKKSFKAETQSGLFIAEEFCPLVVRGKPVEISRVYKFKDEPFPVHLSECEKLGFKLFVKRAAIQNSKHVRVRPRFDEWQVRGRIEVLSPAITPDILESMFKIAGAKCGLLDWRPSSKKSPGPFGQFDHTLARVA